MTPAQIRRLRGALGLRQDQFGQLLGLHSATISRWESDVSPIAPSAWQQEILATIQEALQHRPAVVDEAIGFLGARQPGLALGALLGAAASARPAPPVRRATGRRAPRGPRQKKPKP